MSTPITPTGAAFELRGVSKRYRYFALENLSLRLEPGQILGFVGPNGAGKSTTIRILMGLIAPDSGEVELLGQPMPRGQALAKHDVGYVSEEMGLFGGATLSWHLDFVRSIYPSWEPDYARTLLARFDLHPQQKIRELSRGEQVKALMLMALARRPKLLVLDEPTSGLDPVARHELLAELSQVLHDEDRSILFSSHHTLDVEQISDRIAFLDRGRLVADADKEVFLESWRRLGLELPGDLVVPALPGLVETTRSGRLATITVNNFRPELAADLEQSGVVVREIQRMTLEEIFVATVMHRRKEHER
jgi:ABC-2 type transport system ATP-binding protein